MEEGPASGRQEVKLGVYTQDFADIGWVFLAFVATTLGQLAQELLCYLLLCAGQAAQRASVTAEDEPTPVDSDRTSIISSDYHRNKGRYQFTQCLDLSLLDFLEPLFSQVVKLVKQYIWRSFLVISQDSARSTLELADSC